MCHAQNARFFRKKKYDSNSKVDDSIIRNLNNHNKSMISLALSSKQVDYYAFSYISGAEFIVRIEKGNFVEPWWDVSLWNDSGARLYTCGVGADQIVDILVEVFKRWNLRLELSRAQVQLVKQHIFFM